MTIELVVSNMELLTPHSYITKKPSGYLKQLKETISDGEVITLLDFSENSSFVIQNEAQGYHWTNSHCAVHLVYKNCKNILNLCHPAFWPFFATSHGKSPCDGIGGTVQRMTKASSTTIQRPNYISQLTKNLVILYQICILAAVSRVYSTNWFVGVVNNINSAQVNFMHPLGPCISFYWPSPRQNVCWVPFAYILLSVLQAPSTSSSGRTYSFMKEDLCTCKIEGKLSEMHPVLLTVGFTTCGEQGKAALWSAYPGHCYQLLTVECVPWPLLPTAFCTVVFLGPARETEGREVACHMQ
ncbi:hypothetical protein PR048_002078 [Dryococelus australis]|uniref:Uncharacterized protein n=1 Tax=Dryococelus australis TaxID=614101 RepID=A0ABQ9IJ65_9NEOP|nr:hypothetical protein PR048_002078 [Dryococelus australis]